MEVRRWVVRFVNSSLFLSLCVSRTWPFAWVIASIVPAPGYVGVYSFSNCFMRSHCQPHTFIVPNDACEIATRKDVGNEHAIFAWHGQSAFTHASGQTGIRDLQMELRARDVLKSDLKRLRRRFFTIVWVYTSLRLHHIIFWEPPPRSCSCKTMSTMCVRQKEVEIYIHGPQGG